MKKLILFTCFATLLSFTANAQFSFGLKGGMNYGTISNYKNIDFPGTVETVLQGDGDNAYRFGFNAGLFVNYSLGVVAFQPEVLYSNQGMKNKGSIESFNVDYSSTLKTDYLNIPLMVQLYFIKDILYIEAGPQVGFLLDAKQKFEINAENIPILGDLSSDKTWDVKDNYNTVDFSIAVGAGFKIPVLPLGVNVRYTFGLTEVAKNSNNENKTVNGVLQVGAFLKF